MQEEDEQNLDDILPTTLQEFVAQQRVARADTEPVPPPVVFMFSLSLSSFWVL